MRPLDSHEIPVLKDTFDARDNVIERVSDECAVSLSLSLRHCGQDLRRRHRPRPAGIGQECHDVVR